MRHAKILIVILLTVLSFTPLFSDTPIYQYKVTVFDAIQKRDVAGIHKILNDDPSAINSENWRHDTPLIYALRWRSPDLPLAILEHNPPADVRDAEGLLPVHILVQMHNVTMLERLIALGADIHSRDTKENGDALYWAAAGGNCDMIKYLLDKGLNIDQVSPDGKRPINKAARGGFYRGFLLLVNSGAIMPQTDAEKSMLYQDAVAGGNLDVIEYLANLGYKHGLITSDKEIPVFTALYKANDELLKYLLDQGADVNQLNKEGSSLLLEAVKMHRIDLVRFVIERGVNHNQADKDGLTPLFLAVREYPGAIQYLLDQGVDINQKDKYGDTALLISVYSDSLTSMQILLRNKADLNLQNKNGQSALMLACQNQNEDKAKLLIQAGSNPGIKDVNGRNALHISVLNGNLVLVKELLRSGINPDVKDKDGFTALDYALKYAHKDIATFLKSKQAKTVYKNASQAMEQIDFSHNRDIVGVWYLGDSGIAVRSGKNLLIFDYLKPQFSCINPTLYAESRIRQAPAETSLYNGWINPDEIKGLNVYVFVSNRTMDPYSWDSRILYLKDRIPNVKYIFGFNTQPGWQNYIYPVLPRYRPIEGSVADANGVCVKSISYPQKNWYDENHIGYHVSVNDLNIWYTGTFFDIKDSLLVDYKASIDSFLEENPVIDLAFLPVALQDMDNYPAFKQNSDYFVQTIKPRTIIPVHIAPCVIGKSWSTAYPVIDNSIWAGAAEAMGYNKPTKLLQNPGDHFIFKQRR